MFDLASLFLKVDSTQVKEGVRELDKLADAGAKAEKSVNKFGRETKTAAQSAAEMVDKLKKVGGDMQSLGKKLSIGLTLPLTAFGVSAFNAAKDAAELDSAFDQTFEHMAATMHKWAEETGNAMGRSTREMKEAANTFGIFFNTAVPVNKAAEMSRTFAVLAQDLASFFNVDPGTAIEKLRSGLAGESEPLRQFGVFLNEAAVEAKAFQLGLMGVGNELTDQEKIVARYALILEQTKKAQGDVARTQGGTANQLRAAKAAWEELQIVVGTKLLPVLTPLISNVAALLGWFTQLPAPVQTTVVGIAAFSAAIGPVIGVVGTLLKVLAPMLPLVLKLGPAFAALRIAMLALLANPVMLGAAALITGIYLAWRNWDKITGIVQRVYQGVKAWLQDKLGAVLGWVKAKVDSVKDAFFNLYDKVVGHSYVPDMVDGIRDEFGRLQSVMVDPALTAANQVSEAFAGISGPSVGANDNAPVRNPFDEWARSIPPVKQALQEIQVRGLDGLAMAITDVITGARSLKSAFKDLARSIIADIIQMTVRMLIFRAVSSAFPGLFGGGIPETGAAFGANPTGGAIAMASGGAFEIFGRGGVDKNVLSLNGQPLARVSRGETGLIMPKGRAAPSSGSPSSVNLTVNVHARDAVLTSSVKGWIAEGIAEAAPHIVRAAGQSTIRSLSRPRLNN